MTEEWRRDAIYGVGKCRTTVGKHPKDICRVQFGKSTSMKQATYELLPKILSKNDSTSLLGNISSEVLICSFQLVIFMANENKDFQVSTYFSK